MQHPLFSDTSRTSSRARSRRGAFTLVELLVVIAIIALLIGILVPSLAAARQTARTAQCLSNIRQLELAHAMYMNDHRERLIDAGLGHGGFTIVEQAWPIALADYAGTSLVLRSPVDRSRFWPQGQGGECAGPLLDELIEKVRAGEAAQVPECRWTSYGLNNFTTQFARPQVIDPRTGRFAGPWETLAHFPRPDATVHFLMMTQGFVPGSEEFAKSDHIHVDEWDQAGGGNAPTLANTQMDIAAHGGPGGPGFQQSGKVTGESLSNYGFLDGHARTLRFKAVYRTITDNAFWPDYAR